MAKRTTIRPIPALQEELSQLAREMGVRLCQEWCRAPRASARLLTEDGWQ